MDFIEIDIDYRMDRIEASYLGALLNVGNSHQNVDSLYLIWALGCPPIGPQLRSKIIDRIRNLNFLTFYPDSWLPSYRTPFGQLLHNLQTRSCQVVLTMGAVKKKEKNLSVQIKQLATAVSTLSMRPPKVCIIIYNHAIHMKNACHPP